VIYVVDTSDRERIPESKQAFLKMIHNENVKGVPLLVAANKQGCYLSIRFQKFLLLQMPTFCFNFLIRIPVLIFIFSNIPLPSSMSNNSVCYNKLPVNCCFSRTIGNGTGIIPVPEYTA
jgi:hypothetical protein